MQIWPLEAFCSLPLLPLLSAGGGEEGALCTALPFRGSVSQGKRCFCPRQNWRCPSSPQMQQVEGTGVGLQLPMLLCWCLLGTGHCSAAHVLHRPGGSWAVASCPLFIFSSPIASPHFLLFTSMAVAAGRRLLIGAVASQFFCLPLPLLKASAEGAAPPALPGPHPPAEIGFLAHHPGSTAGRSSASFLWLQFMGRKVGAFLCCPSAGKGKEHLQGKRPLCAHSHSKCHFQDP